LVMDACYKQFPVCALQQIPIELVIRLLEKHDIEADSIEEVVERVSEWEAAFPGGDFAGPFENPGQTLLSGQFCAAAAFLNKPVKSYNFFLENYNDPQICAMGQKVRIIGEKERRNPEIEVTLKDGRKYRIVENPEAGTLVPDETRICEKFRTLTGPVMGERKVNEIVDMVLSLDSIENVKDLTCVLC
jgi:2-methylcitrate dehydratase PrpD